MKEIKKIEERSKLLFSTENIQEFGIDFLEAILKKKIALIKLLPKCNWENFKKIKNCKGSYLNLMINEKDVYEFEIQWEKEDKRSEPIIRIDITKNNYLTSTQYMSQIIAVARKEKKYEKFHNSKYYIIELPKFREGNQHDMNEKINQWISWLDGCNKEWENIAISKNEKIYGIDKKLKK